MSLLDMSLSGAVLILAVAVARTALIHRLPKCVFLVLWGVVLGRLMIPYTLPSAISVYTLLGRLAPAQEAAAGVAVSPLLPMTPTINEAAVAAPAVLATSPTPVNWLNVLWLMGALGCAVFFAANYLLCCRRFQRSLPVDHAAIRQWLEAHPLRRTLCVRVCEYVSTPLTYGALRPVILLPKATDWNDNQSLDYVLAHELVHIRRFDALTKLVLAAALCLHWFNPAVWVMYVLANRDLELSCDETVVRQFGTGARGAYATALIRMEEARGGRASLVNYFSKNAMEERIVAIMKFKKTSLAALVLAAGLVMGVTAAFATSAKPQENGLPPTGSQLDNPAKASVEVQHITSYVDRYDGKTYYSTDNGQTWQEGDPFTQAGYDFSSVEWWSVEEYEQYLEEMKKEFQSMLGERSWNPTEGWYTWDQERIDAAIAGNEQLLQEIKDGKKVSKPTADGDTMIQLSYDPRAVAATAEAIPVSDENPSMEELMAEYGPLGITFDGSTMRYKGKRVELFVDGVAVDGGWALRYSHTDYREGLRLRTVRARKDNGDGSYDPVGPLTDIVPIQDNEADQYAFLFQDSLIQQTDTGVTVKAIAQGGEDGVVLGEQLVQGATIKMIAQGGETSEDNGVDFRDAFNQKFGPYGVSFVPSGTFGNVYWNDRLVSVFVDHAPDGTHQTLSSLDPGGVEVRAVYDSSGNLTGVEEAKRELKNPADEPMEIQEFLWEMYQNGLLQKNTDYDLSFFAQRAAAEGIAGPKG